MSPRRVLREHTSRDLTEWMVYLAENPQGEERADLRAGIVAATVANYAPFQKRGKASVPSDFMPLQTKPRGFTDPEQQAAMMKNWTIAMGGEVKEKK